MSPRSLLVPALAAALFAASGCEKKEAPAPAPTNSGSSGVSGAVDSLKNAGQDLANKASSALEQARTAFVNESQTQLDNARATIDGWKPKVDAMAAETKAEAQSALATVEQKFDAAKAEIAKVRDGKSDTWESLKSGVSTALTDLSTAIKDFAAKFKV